jgi:glycosyltransferase involved in cell wall biosynthesis
MTVAPVTVVIPTYNSGRFVTEAVDSVLSQTLPPAEVVVVDDGSTDDTAARLACYSSRVRYIHQPNGGVASARNRGLQEARAEAIAFLDSDDVWHPSKLEAQVGLLRARPDLGLLGTRSYPWPGETAPTMGPHRVVPVEWEGLIVKNVFVTSSVVVLRDALERVGGFDTRLQVAEDHDLWIRIAESTRAGYLDMPLTGYRNTPASLSKQARRMETGMLQILAKLDVCGAWKRRGWLRRKARSMVHHRCAYMYAEAGEPAAAAWRSVQALLSYPWPYRAADTASRLERPKRLAQSLLQVIRGRPVSPPVDR